MSEERDPAKALDMKNVEESLRSIVGDLEKEIKEIKKGHDWTDMRGREIIFTKVFHALGMGGRSSELCSFVIESAGQRSISARMLHKKKGGMWHVDSYQISNRCRDFRYAELDAGTLLQILQVVTYGV